MLRGRNWAILSIVVLLMALSGSARDVSAANRTAGEGPSAVINGREVPVTTGTVIATGERTANQACNFAPMRVGQRGGSDDPPSEIVMRVTEDCEMVVDAININPAMPAPAQRPDDPSRTAPTSDVGIQSHIVTRLGTAYSTYNDKVGIDLTYAYAEMSFYDDGSRVYSGYNQWHECYVAPDGWEEHSCSGNWSPNGPSVVWVNTAGNFDWVSGTYPHWQKAQFEGYPAAGYYYWCDQSGSLVPYGYWSCSGGSY